MIEEIKMLNRERKMLLDVSLRLKNYQRELLKELQALNGKEEEKK